MQTSIFNCRVGTKYPASTREIKIADAIGEMIVKRRGAPINPESKTQRIRAFLRDTLKDQSYSRDHIFALAHQKFPHEKTSAMLHLLYTVPSVHRDNGMWSLKPINN